MGCKSNLHFLINTIIFSFSFTIILVAHASINPSSLDATFRDFATKTLTEKPITGTLLNVSLPANFSGIQASVVRFRSATFWEKGANFSSFYIPPKVLPFPFVKRFAIVYQDLGKWSDHFYNVPNHSLAAPVIGFTAYDATNLSTLGNETQLNVAGNSVLIRFSKIKPINGNFSGLKCVKFGEGGFFQFSDIAEGNKCVAQSNGHFSLAVPSIEPEPEGRKKFSSRTKLLIAVLSCCVGVILVVIILVSICKLLRQNTMRKMVNESEKGEPFDTTWVGTSKMPRASMVRTQPVLEHGDTV